MQAPDGMGSVDEPDVSHGLLLALLAQHHGGTAVLELATLQATMGDAAGRFYSVAIEPVDGDPTRVRLATVRVGRDADGTMH